jgi:hypothetical protein
MNSYTSFKIDCILNIKNAISSAKFTRNECSIRISYRVGRKMSYISLPTRGDSAQFFKKHGVIKQYAHVNGELVMYRTVLRTRVFDKVPRQYEELERITWEQLELNVAEVKDIIAAHEWGKTSTVLKINNYLKSA